MAFAARTNVLFIRNLPYKITNEELYDLFGKYGPIRQIRLGSSTETKGTAFVVYEDIFDAKAACDHLSGFNIMVFLMKHRAIFDCLYFSSTKQAKRSDSTRKEAEINEMKTKYGV
ncbi:hypothetical protein BC829DRAFT_389226 [Chytridium lagenaria]|nr:hypothetical protein BC829DRAFT_389226 [Chytridium lagenaria]